MTQLHLALALGAALAAAGCQTDSGSAASGEPSSSPTDSAAAPSATSTTASTATASDGAASDLRARREALPRPQVSNMPTPALEPGETPPS